ncbi:MAG: hypothetical protein RQ885_09980 [Desulfurococcales archaeon]|jgi:hypothetical protein|nr:hypothetical protein [Desulfurococcales archaeon]
MNVLEDSSDSFEGSSRNRCGLAIVDLNAFFKCGHPSEKDLEDFDSNLWKEVEYVIRNYSRLFCSKRQKKTLEKFVPSNKKYYKHFSQFLRCIECDGEGVGSGRHEAEYREIADCVRKAMDKGGAILIICLVDRGVFSLNNLCQIAEGTESSGLPCRIIRELNDRVKIYSTCINCINTSCGDSAKCCPSP